MAKKTVAGTPADPTIRFVKIKLSNETYSLCFDFNAWALAEHLTSLNLLEAVRKDQLSASELRAMFYAFLHKGHPTLSIEDVGNLITPREQANIVDAIAKAYLAGMPDQESDPNDGTLDTEPANS